MKKIISFALICCTLFLTSSCGRNSNFDISTDDTDYQSEIEYSYDEETSDNKNISSASQGITSLDELTEILMSDYLFTEEQIACMSLPMLLWCYDEFLNIGESFGNGRDFKIETHTPRQLCDDIATNREGYEKAKLVAIEWEESEYDFYSDIDLDWVRSIYGDENYSLMLEQVNNLEKTWVAINYTVETKEGKVYTYGDDDALPLYAFLIGGEYYWTYIECY